MSTSPVPGWVRAATAAAVSVVAAVAAVASYVHMHELATEAGEGWRAHLIPLSVDGLLVAASMVMLVRRRSGQAAGVLPWLGLVLGLAASLGANVAVADPTVISWIVSGWPPLALAVAFELLILVTREKAQVSEVQTREEVGQIDPPESNDSPAAEDVPSVAELVAAGWGRRRIAKELGLKESEARRLVDAHRTNGHPVAGGVS